MAYITSTTSGVVLNAIATAFDPVTLASGGSVTNNTTLYYGNAIFGTATPWDLTNFGFISTTAALGSGVDLRAGGTVTNAATAVIAGNRAGIYIAGPAIVANLGTVSAISGNGVDLTAGGTIVNGGTGNSVALIQGGNAGVSIGSGAGGTGIITNYGTITGVTVGVYVASGASAVVANLGTITATGSVGYINGVYLAAGTVTNGAPSVASALISGVRYGVQIADSAASISNFGTILGAGRTDSIGVYLTAGGILSNAEGALIASSHVGAAFRGSAPSTIANLGTIAGFGTVGFTDGVYINGADTVINGSPTVTTALITSAIYGVVMCGTAGGEVSNFGTIIGGGTGTAAIGGVGVGVYFRGNGAVTNGASDATAALISGVNYAIKMAGTATGTVVNFGTIVSTIAEDVASQTYPDAIYIKGIGTIVNGATNATSALISAEHQGIYIAGTGASDITNFGTIRGTSTYGTGIYLNAAGIVANAPSGLISGIDNGVVMQGSAAGTVNNLGTIAGIGTLGFVTGVYIKGLGNVVNGETAATAALITGVRYGVEMAGTAAASTVTNFGTIAGGVTGSSGTGGHPTGVYIQGRGSVVNGALGAPTALIAGTNYGVKMGSSAAGTVNNFGTIISTTTANAANHVFPDAIYIKGPGAVVNGATDATSALISGGFDGIAIEGTAVSSVSNFGTIEGTATVDGAGIYLAAAGIVSNAQSGLISGKDDGLVMKGTVASSVNNLGTIVGGVSGGAGIYSFGVYIEGAGLVVNGATNATAALIRGADYGVGLQFLKGSATATLAGYATVRNFGTVVGGDGTTGQGVYVGDRGSVINGASNSTTALISGGEIGIKVTGVTGTVINYGDVVATAATGTGIYLSFGTVTNFGTVVAGANGTGIYLYGGNVTNSGTIIAPAATAVIVRYGTFFNAGLVEGAVSGIELSLGTGTAGTGAVNVSGTVIGATGISVAPTSTAGQTVTVYGTVIGTSGTAVSLTTGGSDRLVVAPGAAFTGFIDGGGGTSVLEITGTFASGLGGSGMVQGLGTVAYVGLGSITNFSALAIDPSVTFGGSGALTFPTLVNEGQVNVGPGNSLALGVASAAGGGIIDLQAGGTIDFQGAVSNQIVIFQPPGGVAEIDHPELFSGTLSGFTGTGDIVDLTQFSPAGATATLNGSDQLVVTNGAQSVSLQLDTGESYTGIRWDARADHNGTGNGTEIVPVCFCRGTLILTDRGEVAVERLAVGDRVVTLGGAAAPIQWIGFGRDLVTGKNSLARPIVVRAGALADAVPRRDLYLTHGHALYLDGALIPVENLVNHRSILWDEAARVVEYYHIELAGHDVVFAEGAPAESYYDAGNRALFQNARQGSQAGAATSTFAPVLTDGDIVEKVWAALDRRAGGRHDGDTTDDPDLHLVIAGARLDPVSRAAGVYTFSVDRAPAGPLLLRSRSGVPSLTGLGRHDHRRLGVAIRQIILCAAGVMTSLDRDAPYFRDGGCHLPEAGHSWTDGELSLPAALFGHLTGAFTLVVHTKKEAMRYPIPTQVKHAA